MTHHRAEPGQPQPDQPPDHTPRSAAADQPTDPELWSAPSIAEQPDPPRRRRPGWLTNDRLIFGGIALAAVLAVALFFAATLLGTRGQQAEQQRDQLGAQAVPLSNVILELCAGSAGGDVAQALASAGACPLSAAVKSKASEAGLPTAVASPAPKVDEATLRNYVQASVAAYCADRHDCTPDTAVLVPIVADYLAKHPPTQPKPTDAQVRDAVAFVITANPDAFKGADGRDGADAPPVSDDQVAAQVSAYCAAHGQCGGPQGPQGPQGVSVVRLDFAVQDGQCRAVVTLFDPASGNTSSVSAPAGAAACPAEVPPTDPPTTDPPETTETPERGGLGGLLGGG